MLSVSLAIYDNVITLCKVIMLSSIDGMACSGHLISYKIIYKSQGRLPYVTFMPDEYRAYVSAVLFDKGITLIKADSYAQIAWSCKKTEE